MGRCFVIQPFDQGKFDKRYDDVFSPAIENAGLEPYRVDRDPSVRIPIENIQEGIKNSEICLADITTDNPNVWFELGFALAVPKEVVLVCSEERTSSFPFDVQHRNILRYNTESTSDFKKLQTKITERIKGLLGKKTELDRLSMQSPVADTEGLSQHEMIALVTIMESQLTSNSLISPDAIKNDMNRVGFTDIAVSLSLYSLVEKGFISEEHDTDWNENSFTAYSVTDEGRQWLFRNQDKLVLKRNRLDPVDIEKKEDSADDLPF